MEIDGENTIENTTTNSQIQSETEKSNSLPPINENDKTPPLTTLQTPPLTNNQSTQININDGDTITILKSENIKSLPNESTPNTPTPLTPFKPQEDEHGVVIVSNLSLPIETFEPPKSPSITVEKPKVKPVITVSKSTTPIIRPSPPTNPYIYVAPELQRKYTYKSRNRRAFFNRRGRFYQNRTYTITSPSPAISNTNGNNTNSPGVSKDNKKDSAKTEEKSGDNNVETSTSASAMSVSTTAGSMSMVSPQINMVNSHAFVVGKNQIACCESFNNKILKEKAEKNIGYECRAFVIGLKVVNRVLAIDTTADGQTLEQVSRFDFSRSVVHFLKGLNHIYTDSHIIIELVNCNRIPHFLFPQYQYKRPKKDFIKNHQQETEKYHIKWRSKSCLATMGDDTKKALTPKNSASVTPKVKIITPKSSVSQTPKFDEDDALMNDDSIVAMPGLGLPPAQVDVNNIVETTMDVNMEVDNDNDNDNDNDKGDEKINVNGDGKGCRKRKADDVELDKVSNE
eukprot:727010_1